MGSKVIVDCLFVGGGVLVQSVEDSDELKSVKFDVPGCCWVLEAACDEGPFVLEVVEVG